MSKSPDEKRQAFEAALRTLEVRPLSATEMRQRLRKRGFSQEIAEETTQRLQELKLLNDAVLARSVTEGMLRRKVGQRRALQTLKRRGISGDEAQEAVSEGFSAIDEVALAKECGQKKDRSLQSKDLIHRKAGVARHLAYRGFSADSVRQALNEIYGS